MASDIVKITKEEPSSNNPLQFRIKTYKEVDDMNGIKVFVLKSETVTNDIEHNDKVAKLNQQIADSQAKILELTNMKTEIDKTR